MPKLELDTTFEQKNDIAKAVEDELEKVTDRTRILLLHSFRVGFFFLFLFCVCFLRG